MKPKSEIRAEWAKENLSPQWDTRRVAALEGAVQRRIDRRRRQMQAGAVLALFVVVGGAVVLPNYLNKPSNTGFENLQLADGSRIEVLDPQTDLQQTTQSENEVVYKLNRGKARFRVTQNVRRTFRVRAENVEVEVLGTIFEVGYKEGKEVEVRVQSGLVRVHYAQGTALLRPGEVKTFDNAPVSLVQMAPGPTLDEFEGNNERNTPRSNWHKKARAQWRTSSTDPVGRLLDAADEAQTQKRYAEAVGALRQIVRQFPKDSRVALAAFDVGCILADEQRRYVEAAQAFADVQKFDPHPELAADALAREGEAWWNAGKKDKARATVTDFIAKYPDSVHVRKLRRLVFEQ